MIGLGTKRAVLTLLFFASVGLGADTLILMNGEHVEGRIIEQSRTQITIQTAGGARTYHKKDIREFSYGESAAEKIRKAAARRAEQERQAKAEQEKRAKAEQEKQAKAEQEKQAKAEQEKQAKAEQEKQAKAEQEKRAKAEQEKQAKAEQEKRKKPEQEKRGILWWSFLLPGAGHLGQGETFKGVVLLGGSIGVLGVTRSVWTKNTVTKREYDNDVNLGVLAAPFFQDSPIGMEYWILPLYAKSVQNRQRNDSLRQRINILGSVAVGIYLLNVLDSFYPLERLMPRNSAFLNKERDFEFYADIQKMQSGAVTETRCTLIFGLRF